MMRAHHLLAAALAVSLGACAAEVAPEEPGLEETEQWALNQWALNGFMLNGLVGTATTLELLIANPLSSATFDPDSGALPYVLNDPEARVFMRYLASCALTGKQAPIEFDDVDGEHHVFRGGLGFCPAWAGGPASVDCQEMVSACLFTRNNAEGMSVMLSIRGATLAGPAVALSSQMAAKSTLPDGATIASFSPCPAAQNGPTRNCGWTASRSLLGTCTPGQNVTLACAGTASAMVARVCDGISGCNHLSAAQRAEDTVCSPGKPSLAFVCGPDGAFAAMTGPVSSGQALSASFSGAAGGVFPAAEGALFGKREGAFYGNVFDPSRHNSLVSVTVDALGNVDRIIPGGGSHVVFQDAWACHDAAWTNGDAYSHHRRCAIATDDHGHMAELCAASSVGLCRGGLAPACASGDGAPVAGDKDFAGCKDGGNVVREWPLTTMLHDACDQLPAGMGALCQRR